MRRLSHVAVVKEVHRRERLLDQAALFLHLPLERLSESQRQVISDLHDGDKTLSGRKVLIVDDDIRNIFALTSILEQHQVVTLAAENGRDAITILERTPGVDVVLMDVMMPDMDGLDTTRAIRQIHPFRDLPIIAVTAKAMKGDREKCIEAGAWDYLAKPVDPEELLSMLRAWLVR
jgi:CheY-like chemotaxis protein